ncbi:hypothetical protein D3C84_818640 [compost metagenome]
MYRHLLVAMDATGNLGKHHDVRAELAQERQVILYCRNFLFHAAAQQLARVPARHHFELMAR